MSDRSRQITLREFIALLQELPADALDLPVGWTYDGMRQILEESNLPIEVITSSYDGFRYVWLHT